MSDKTVFPDERSLSISNWLAIRKHQSIAKIALKIRRAGFAGDRIWPSDDESSRRLQESRICLEKSF